MSDVSILLFLMLITTATLPFVVAYQLTSLAHSNYRNRLWLLRDRIADDLRTGRISDSATAGQIRCIVERQIRVAGRHTLADSLLAISVFEVPGKVSVFDEILQEGTPKADRDTLMGYLADFRHATARHLMWGSVVGWFATGTIGSAIALVDAWRKVRKRIQRAGGPQSRRKVVTTPMGQAAQELRKKVERAEVEIMPTAAPSRRSRARTREQHLADVGV